jgi:hypothetical protein
LNYVGVVSGLALCGSVDRCQRFGETCCLHLQGWSDDWEVEGLNRIWRTKAVRREPTTEIYLLRNHTAPKPNTSIILTAVRTSNLNFLRRDCNALGQPYTQKWKITFQLRTHPKICSLRLWTSHKNWFYLLHEAIIAWCTSMPLHMNVA